MINAFEYNQLPDGICVFTFNNNTRAIFDTWYDVVNSLYNHDIESLHMRFLYIVHTSPTLYGIKKFTDVLGSTPKSIKGSVAVVARSKPLRTAVNNIVLMVNSNNHYKTQLFETQPQATTWLRERTDIVLKETNTPPFTKIVWQVASETYQM